MATEHSPAFQFYVRDWLGNANVRAMSPEARGVYMDLLCYCWQEGHISSDVPTLARLAGLPLARFRRLWGEIEPRFQQNGTGYRHARLDKERQAQQTHRDRQSERGRKGALALWRKHVASDAHATADTMLGDGSSSALNTQNPPTPPLQGGPKLTRKDLAKAEEIRRQAYGRCPHEPACQTFDECVRQIALERKTEALPA